MNKKDMSRAEILAARKKKQTGVGTGMRRAGVQVSERDARKIHRSRAELMGLEVIDDSCELTAEQMSFVMRVIPKERRMLGMAFLTKGEHARMLSCTTEKPGGHVAGDSLTPS